MLEDKLFIKSGRTPLTIADAVIRECQEKEWLEDVIYYINAYIKRTFTESEIVKTPEPTKVKSAEK